MIHETPSFEVRVGKPVPRKEDDKMVLSTAAGAPGIARGSTSAVLARGYKPRASGEPKARPLTLWIEITAAGGYRQTVPITLGIDLSK